MGAMKSIDIVMKNHDLQGTRLAKSPGGEFLGSDQIDLNRQFKNFLQRFPQVSTVEAVHWLTQQTILIRFLGNDPVPGFAEILEGAFQMSPWTQVVLFETDSGVEVWTTKESPLHQQVVERIAELLP